MNVCLMIVNFSVKYVDANIGKNDVREKFYQTSYFLNQGVIIVR